MNPFRKFKHDRKVWGRKIELEKFNQLLDHATNKNCVSVNFWGPLGVGKTYLLKYFEKRCREEAIRPVFVRIKENEGLNDLEDKIKMVSGSKIDELGEELPEGKFGTIILIDDINKKIREKVIEIEDKDKEKWLSFITTSNIRMEEMEDIRIKNFDKSQCQNLLKNILEEDRKFGSHALDSIMEDSSGNPKTFVKICEFLYDKIDKDIIAQKDYHRLKPKIKNIIGREWFDRIYSKTSELEVKVIMEMDGKSVSEIANKLGKKTISSLIERLKRKGEIIKKRRGKYRPFCNLYREYLIDRKFNR